MNKTQFSILENNRHKLVSIAKSMEERAGNRSEEELIDMTDDVQYNKGCSQKLAITLMDSQDVKLARKARETMLEAIKATQKSGSKLRSCSRKLIACRGAQQWVA
jgi:hypothetical protein